MPVEYDPRRPRVPREVAERIDAARGQVPFNRWVVSALERATLSDEKREGVPTRERFENPRNLESVHLRCPATGCTFTAPSPKAVCPAHGRTVR